MGRHSGPIRPIEPVATSLHAMQPAPKVAGVDARDSVTVHERWHAATSQSLRASVSKPVASPAPRRAFLLLGTDRRGPPRLNESPSALALAFNLSCRIRSGKRPDSGQPTLCRHGRSWPKALSTRSLPLVETGWTRNRRYLRPHYFSWCAATKLEPGFFEYATRRQILLVARCTDQDKLRLGEQTFDETDGKLSRVASSPVRAIEYVTKRDLGANP